MLNNSFLLKKIFLYLARGHQITFYNQEFLPSGPLESSGDIAIGHYLWHGGIYFLCFQSLVVSFR